MMMVLLSLENIEADNAENGKIAVLASREFE